MYLRLSNYRNLKGDKVKQGWAGGIPDVPYRYGPGFASPYEHG